MANIIPTSPVTPTRNPAMGMPTFNAGQGNGAVPTSPTIPTNPVFDPGVRTPVATIVTGNCVSDVNTIFNRIATVINNTYGKNIPMNISNAYNALYNSAKNACNTTTTLTYNSKKECQDATTANFIALRDSRAWTTAQLWDIGLAYDKAMKACDKLAGPTTGTDTGFTVTNPTNTGGNINIQSTQVKCVKLPSGQYFPAGCAGNTGTTTPVNYSSPMKWGITLIIIGVVGYLIYKIVS